MTTLTEDQAKQYLSEIRQFASVASLSANAATRAERNIDARIQGAATNALTAQISSVTIVSTEPGEVPEWDPHTNILRVPRGEAGADGVDGADGADGQNGADGEDGQSITIRLATTDTAEALSVQYPNDLIVVPAA